MTPTRRVAIVIDLTLVEAPLDFTSFDRKI